RLQVAEGIAADPHLLPGRRDCELLQPQDLVRVADRLTIRADVAEAPAGADATETRPRAIRAPQTCPAPRRDGRGDVGHQTRCLIRSTTLSGRERRARRWVVGRIRSSSVAARPARLWRR